MNARSTFNGTADIFTGKSYEFENTIAIDSSSLRFSTPKIREQHGTLELNGDFRDSPVIGFVPRSLSLAGMQRQIGFVPTVEFLQFKAVGGADPEFP